MSPRFEKQKTKSLVIDSENLKREGRLKQEKNARYRGHGKLKTRQHKIVLLSQNRLTLYRRFVKVYFDKIPCSQNAKTQIEPE